MKYEKEIIQFAFSKGKFEVRSCQVGYFGETNNPISTAELVYWNEERTSCYSIAIWEQGKEDFSLKFYGNRGVDFLGKEDFIYCCRKGQKMLDINLEEF